MEKIKNQLYTKIINSDYFIKSKMDEHKLMKEASIFLKDEEFEKLRLKYEELKKYPKYNI